MQPDASGRRPTGVWVDPGSWGLSVKRRASVRWAALVAVGAVILTGCQGGENAASSGTAKGGAAAQPATPATPAASIVVTPANGTAKVRPDGHVDVKVTDGTL